MDGILVANSVLSAALASLIWVVQLVIYPQFKAVPDNHLKHYAKQHANRIGRVVIPLMTLELIALLALWALPYFYGVQLIVASLCLLGIWLSTALFQAPTHFKIQQTANAKDVHFLIHSNWIRTVLWSIKLIAMVVIL